MKVPISWLADFVDLSDLTVTAIAHVHTMGGLEVEDIRFVGLPLPADSSHGFKISGLGWAPDKIVVAEVRQVNAHPNADRLTLCELFDGEQVHTVLTGAPNMFPYKGQGPLAKPMKVAYAREGATLYDGHSDEPRLTTLKRTKIRGVESYSMVCSEKELGISEEHEGIIELEEDAPVGIPLADYMGDAVLEVKINPNMARNTSILGIAREVAALTGRELRKPDLSYPTAGQAVTELARIEISNPELNPRFTLGLVRGVKIGPSPYKAQRRLRLVGMRPISNIVDATNYAMFELGEPLHAFDYQILRDRAGGGEVVISTRTARPGETLRTLDGQERKLSASNVLVCDQAGALSLAGVMGGLESEITAETRDILLEAAAWNFINIRRTANQHGLPSEASYRYSRGMHPALALNGLKRCLQLMSLWSGGTAAPGIVDNYPLPPRDPQVIITPREIRRALGIDIPLEQVKTMLERLEFSGRIADGELRLQTPPIRLDIGEDLVGVADVMEEIARLYGYDNIPETRMSDELPPQHGHPLREQEERVRDILAEMGLQEVITHRMTSPEWENRFLAGGEGARGDESYVRLINPITPEKRVLRRSLLASTLSALARNLRLNETLAFFEIGPVFEPTAQALPREPGRLAIALTGLRQEPDWQNSDRIGWDFFDIKGILDELCASAHVAVKYARGSHPSFHPGKCALIQTPEGVLLGILGEMHPLALKQAEINQPVFAAEIDLDALLALMPPRGYPIVTLSEYPPIKEDLAVVVGEDIPAERVEEVIRQGGGRLLHGLQLFDIFRGPQLGEGKKSLAYALTYQAPDRTLTDKDAANLRGRIIRRLEQELGAKLRS